MLARHFVRFSMTPVEPSSRLEQQPPNQTHLNRLGERVMAVTFFQPKKKPQQTLRLFLACKILAMSRLAGVDTGLLNDKQRSCFPFGEQIYVNSQFA